MFIWRAHSGTQNKSNRPIRSLFTAVELLLLGAVSSTLFKYSKIVLWNADNVAKFPGSRAKLLDISVEGNDIDGRR